MGAKSQTEEPNNQVNVENHVFALTRADVNISPVRVTKSVTWTLNFLHPIDLETRKENLIKATCRENNADILIDPQFIYSKRIMGGGKLIVSGYPAKYVNFNSMSQDEVDSLFFGKNFKKDKIIFINDKDIE